MRRLVRWFLVLALSLSIGLQWAVVQGAAWVGMIVSFSKEATISQTLSRTFDGSHPCKLCHAAQRGESTQKKQDTDTPAIKFVLAAPELEPFVVLQGASDVGPARALAVTWWAHPPPVPPPKAA